MSQQIELLLKAKNLTDEAFKAVEGHVNSLENSTGKAGSTFARAQKSFESFGSNAIRLGTGLTAGLTLPLAAVGATSLKAAMDAVESENLFAVSFKGMADAARAWSEEVSGAVGANEFELRKNAATLFTMANSMNVAQDEAFTMATSLTELAGDMASFYNLPHEVTFQKIQAGLTGEAEPLKRLGILIDANTVKTVAYQAGIAKQGEALTEVQKVQARYLAIMQQTSDAQGDLARTLDSPTNQMRVMKEQLSQLAIEFGIALLPVIQELLTVLKNDLIPAIKSVVDWFTGLDPATQRVVIILGGLVAALGPVLMAVGSLASGIGALIPLFTAAVPAVAGATAALGPFAAIVAGIAGGAALGLWLRENSEGFRTLTNVVGDAFSALSGLSLYNKLQEQGRDVTEEWTDAQRESLEQFKAMQQELLKTAEATEETTEAFAEMKDKVVGHSYVPDMLDAIRSEFLRLDHIMLDPVRDVVKSVKDAFKEMGDWIGGFFGDLAGSIGGIFAGLLGSALGNLAGKALDWVGGLFRDAEEEVNDLRDAFFDAHGGWQAFYQELLSAGLDAEEIIHRIWDAETVDQFNAAIAETMGMLDLQKQAEEDLQAAVEKYGFTIDELGPKWAAQELDKQAGQLLKDYELLKASGIDVNTIIERMGPAFNEYVNSAIAAGQSIPMHMKPIIDQMIENGELLDENGEAYKSAEEAGITFTESLSEGLSRVIESIEKLVAALLGIPAVQIPVNYEDPGPPPGYPPGGGYRPYDFARGGVVLPFRPRAAAEGLVVASRPGGELVRMGEAGKAELAAPVEALLSKMQETALRAVRGQEQRIVLQLDSQTVADVMIRRNRAGLMPIHEASVGRY